MLLLGEPIDICQTTHSPTVRIHPNDIIMADSNGVVRVRPEWLSEILSLCEQQTRIDECCMEDLRAGHSVQKTFAKHRGQ